MELSIESTLVDAETADDRVAQSQIRVELHLSAIRDVVLLQEDPAV